MRRILYLVINVDYGRQSKTVINEGTNEKLELMPPRVHQK